MSDPIKAPEQNDPGNVSGKGTPASTIGPTRRHKMYWGWIVGIIVLLLILWGFFGMDHEKPVIHPAMEPAPAASTLD
jgi:hypothetical protein